ncbi:hypothetical protein [Chitinophaga japonensis]|uniref:Lysozyme family protein n=1 Tax=Chitinophaga japonensis TaxID=104662 RepID=A0A562T5V8_CHIJA|nr:hypothetical protein [Chitinophaga japonensis]TWI88648.1 lysozyme family protein [Chitinophaga japonensis]
MPAVSTTPTDIEYIQLFDSCKIKPEKLGEINSVINKMTGNQKRYEYISLAVKYGIRYADYYMYERSGYCYFFESPNDTSLHPALRDYMTAAPVLTAGSKGAQIPWYFIACIHFTETGGSFNRHLHNGDPLLGFTKMVPKGRPQVGHKPPFEFEESAIDALKFLRIDRETYWNLPRMLRWLEKYNGIGYYAYHNKMLTPYLWSYSNHYNKGKYRSDGKFDANLVSKQPGCAVILKRMEELGLIKMLR